MSPRLALTAGLAVLLGAACREEPAPALASLAPAPLPVLTPAGAGPEVAAVAGEPLPQGAVRWRLQGRLVREGTRAVDVHAPGAAAARVAALGPPARVLLAPDGETFLAEAAPLLAALDDAGAEVWLLHPEGRVAYRLRLRDEPAFRAWLDTPEPGRLRVVQRGDGFELATSVGKLRGPDANGPTVPLREGRQDVASLRRGLSALAGRFPGAREVCLVPSFGMELARVAEALSATFTDAGDPLLTGRCLVYPRPR